MVEGKGNIGKIWNKMRETMERVKKDRDEERGGKKG